MFQKFCLTLTFLFFPPSSFQTVAIFFSCWPPQFKLSSCGCKHSHIKSPQLKTHLEAVILRGFFSWVSNCGVFLGDMLRLYGRYINNTGIGETNNTDTIVVMVWTAFIFTTSLKWVVWFSVFTAALSDTMKAPSLTNIFHYRIHMISFFFNLISEGMASRNMALSFALLLFSCWMHCIYSWMAHSELLVSSTCQGKYSLDSTMYQSTIHCFFFHLSAKGQQVIGLFAFYHSQCTMGDFFLQ